MFCSKCGEESDDGAKYCKKCCVLLSGDRSLEKELDNKEIRNLIDGVNSYKEGSYSLDDFCGDFYELILRPKIKDVDVSHVFPEYIRKTIQEVYPKFKDVDLQKLVNEIEILRFEIFSLAWVHRFGEESSFAQTLFTSRYLRENEREDIWDGMLDYNKAIANTTTLALNKRKKAEIIKKRVDIADRRIEMAKEKRIDLENDDLYLQSIGKTINRLFSENAWNERQTPVLLIYVFMKRLGLESDYEQTNEETQFRLYAYFRGFYESSSDSWSNVKILDNM